MPCIIDRLPNTDRLLVVEDDPDILSIVLRHLRANDFVPNGFANPFDALQEFQSDPTRYWLVLTDIRMPGMNGIALAREVLKINPQTKIVLMTAHEYFEEQIRTDLPVINRDDIIKKPFKLTEICNRVKLHARAR